MVAVSYSEQQEPSKDYLFPVYHWKGQTSVYLKSNPSNPSKKGISAFSPAFSGARLPEGPVYFMPTTYRNSKEVGGC